MPSKNTTSKVLITGIAGLIGSHMADHLIKRGYFVHGVDNLSGGYIDNVPTNAMFYECDLLQENRLSGIFDKVRPDYVYHFAAYAAEGLSPFIRNFNYSNNLLCSVNVINECVKHNVKKIIFTSSMAVYGEQNPPFKESQTPYPEDPYGISKYAVEMDLRQAYKQFGLKYNIVRPHNVIGVRQNIWDKYRNVIGIWIRSVLRGESIMIFGDGLQKRAFSDIAYCLDPMEKLLNSCDNEVFNIGSDKEYTLKQVAELVVKVAQDFEFKPVIEYAEGRKEVKYAYCDHAKAKELLNFKDKTDLEETIKEMFLWAMRQEDRPVKPMQYEVNKGMYSYWK